MLRRPAAGMAAASTTDFPAAPAASAPPSESTARAGAGSPHAPRNFYLGLGAVCLVIGALSLLIPSTPSYDPWSWLLWSRQIVHGHLVITTGGTSWKPLPMIFTIPFALFGKAAPDLWLVVARAGALAAVVMVFRLSFRLTRQVTGLFGEAGEEGRVAAIAPALLAGVIGAVALALSASGGFVSSNTLGYSEGLATALLLIAVERLIDGRPRQAFIVGFFVALDRPEIWLFWGPLGLWLLWKDPAARALVVGSAVLMLVAWFLPVYLGCGSVSCSVSRAVHPRSNSLAFASNPFMAELTQAAWQTMLLRIKVVAALLVAAVAVISWRTWRREGVAGLRTPGSRARIATALLGLGGLSWFVVIAVMTEIGFSGNNRYLVLGAALVDICGAIGYGWAAWELAILVPRALRRARDTGPVSAVARWASVALLALIFLIGPNWVGANLISIPRTHGSLVYQAHLRDGMEALVARFGGAKRVLACGTVMTEGFQVPMVSWILGVPATRVEAPPATGEEPGPAPNVVLQTRDTRSAARLPYLSSWPTVTYHYIGTAGPVHMFTSGCSGTST